jgi:O-acetylhomoserine (thiol)-lyase
VELVDEDLVPVVIDHLELIQFAANIGDTRTLVAHPATMTHCRLNQEQLEAAGISRALLRLSVGLEDPTDLLADLTRALDAALLASHTATQRTEATAVTA